MKAVGYVRVSTEDQADKGLSLDAQRDRIKRYAELYGLELVMILEDKGVSAKTLKRDGVQAALMVLERGEAQALVVSALDRLTRSVKDLGDLLDEYFGEGGAQLLSVAEQIDTRTAGGRLVLNILGSVAQWQRENISENTARVARYKREQGEYTGGHVRYGYAIDPKSRKLVPETREQRIKAIAIELRNKGRSLREIGRELARRGFLTRKGSLWGAFQVAVILR